MSDDDQDALSDHSLHDDPTFKEIEDIIRNVGSELDGLNGDDAMSHVSTLANPRMLAHMSFHRLLSISTETGAPQNLLMMMLDTLIPLWMEGFIIGARFQSRRDADLVSVSVPDFVPTDFLLPEE